MQMHWAALALLSAFGVATSDALAKKTLATVDEHLVVFLRLVIALPFLLLLVAARPVTPPGREFFTTLAIMLPFELAALVLYTKAIKHSPLGLTLPFLSLTPIVLIVLPAVILGERLSAAGMGGVVLIAAGSYTLNIRDLRHGLFAPFKAIGRERGSRYMVIVACIYGFTSTMAKRAIMHGDPMLFAAALYIGLIILTAPMAFLRARNGGLQAIRPSAAIILMLSGACYALGAVTHFQAFLQTNVAYASSVKRLGLFIGVLYGWLFFGEHGIGEHLSGTVLMAIGFALIVHPF